MTKPLWTDEELATMDRINELTEETLALMDSIEWVDG